MNVRVKLFAAAREIAGSAEIVIDTPSPATAGCVRSALAAQQPKLAALTASSLLAVNAEYANDATQVSPDDEVALIPPVSGG